MLAGIGFRGYDEKTGAPLWDGASNVDIPAFELATSIRDLSKAWNCLTQKWLQHYVYERVPAFKMLATYFISAFWHGFYPGYYLMFLSVIAPQQVGRRAWPRTLACASPLPAPLTTPDACSGVPQGVPPLPRRGSLRPIGAPLPRLLHCPHLPHHQLPGLRLRGSWPSPPPDPRAPAPAPRLLFEGPTPRSRSCPWNVPSRCGPASTLLATSGSPCATLRSSTCSPLPRWKRSTCRAPSPPSRTVGTGALTQGPWHGELKPKSPSPSPWGAPPHWQAGVSPSRWRGRRVRTQPESAGRPALPRSHAPALRVRNGPQRSTIPRDAAEPALDRVLGCAVEAMARNVPEASCKRDRMPPRRRRS